MSSKKKKKFSKLPPSIKVFGHSVSIEVVDDLKDSSGDQLLGCFKEMENKIYLWSDCSNRIAQRTLIHELMHTYLIRSGISQTMSHKTEETLCCLVENFVELFRQKELVKFFNEK